MDRRPLDRVFFVYDHSVIQREEDDPKDAIAYFYPPNFSIDTQCLLCGQLMGMVNFLKILCSSEPRIFKLRKMKVTTKHEGNFTLALAHDPKLSDTVAIAIVKNLYDLFCMYHGSLTRLLKHCHGNRETFSSQMSSIWNCYLPFIRHHGNNMKMIFHAVPTIELPKKCGWIFLKCSHLLQWLKRKPWLLAGCLLYKNKVLCTQMTSDLMSRLFLVKASQSPFPGEKITTDFDLPFGVRILSIYLRNEDYKLFAKQESAADIRHGKGDAMSEGAFESKDESHQKEELGSGDGDQMSVTTLPYLQQLKEDGSNRCNRDSSESDAGQRTSSSQESSDAVSQFAQTNDALMDSGRHQCHRGDEEDTKCSLTDEEIVVTECRRNIPEFEGRRQEHLSDGAKTSEDAKVIDIGNQEAEVTLDIDNFRKSGKSQDRVDIHNKSNHEHSKVKATGIAFDTKVSEINGIIHNHEDIICGYNNTHLSSHISSSHSNESKDKETGQYHSGEVETNRKTVISTAVSELNAGCIGDILLPKVEVNHAVENLEDEPFEIHINPLDSESSPEHSDSSGNAGMARHMLEPLADDNGNILPQDEFGHLDRMDAGADGYSQAVGLRNGGDDRMLGNIVDSFTLSKNNSHSRDSLSQERLPAMQQLPQRGGQQPSLKTTFSHSYSNEHIPHGTEPNFAKHEGSVDYASVPEYSTPKASRNLSRSGAGDASTDSPRQTDQTPYCANSALLTDNSDQTNHPNSHTVQPTSDQGLGSVAASVHHDSVASDQPKDNSQSPTGGLVRADGTRRKGWTRSRSTSPTSGKKVISQEASEEERTKVEGMVNVSLYVQAHSDTMLIFLGKKDWIQDRKRLLEMWQSLVMKLSELEPELQQVLDDKVPHQEQDQVYNFLQFSPFEKSVKTNTASVLTMENKQFVNVVDAMHEMFVSKDQVNHLVMRGQHSTVIGSQNDAYQTYFQPLRPQSSFTTSTSASSPSPGSSSPIMHATSAMATRQGKLEVQAEKILLRDHGIRFM
ncbi:uncharacterized protein LOC129254703 [Lytechinus pictus]|uniref:uncharacterized protein LOC129254703 n=1 Tax=Lytechinus pictus TaxID=7653 RepID=UPI0030BA24C3